jgi:hypothetical protein
VGVVGDWLANTVGLPFAREIPAWLAGSLSCRKEVTWEITQR